MFQAILRFSTLWAALAVICAPVVSGQVAPDIQLVPPPTDPVDLGDVRVGNSSATQNITFRNDGGGTLTVVSATLASGTQFTLEPAPVGHFASLENFVYGVSATPLAVGSISDTLQIESDDPDTPTYTMTLNATGVRSHISTSTTGPLDFGMVESGTSSTAQSVTIFNLNDTFATTLNGSLSFSPSDSNFAVSPGTPFSIDPGSSLVLSVYFTPQSTGTHGADLVIASDDPDTPVVRVGLTGDGTPTGSGNSGTAGNTGCLIETLAAGSSLDGYLNDLRAQRDRVSASSAWGRRAVAAYYALSRHSAGWFAAHEAPRTTARWAVTPVVLAALHPAMALGLLAGGLLVGLCLQRRRR